MQWHVFDPTPSVIVKSQRRHVAGYSIASTTIGLPYHPLRPLRDASGKTYRICAKMHVREAKGNQRSNNRFQLDSVLTEMKNGKNIKREREREREREKSYSAIRFSCAREGGSCRAVEWDMRYEGANIDTSIRNYETKGQNAPKYWRELRDCINSMKHRPRKEEMVRQCNRKHRKAAKEGNRPRAENKRLKEKKKKKIRIAFVDIEPQCERPDQITTKVIYGAGEGRGSLRRKFSV